MIFSDFGDQLKQLRNDLPSSRVKGVSNQPEPDTAAIPRHIIKIPDDRRSKAPYNFVPINEKVAWAECRKPDDYNFSDGFNTTIRFKNTGYIELEIETLGDVFIGHKAKCSDFFSINNTLHIPGSSLRGLIRTYVEILSFGKFGCFDDRHLYFRTFASNSSVLRDLYNNRTKGEDPDTWICKHVKAGYLKKKGAAYYICPAQECGDKGSQYKRYEKKHFLKHFQWQKIEGGHHIFRSGPKFGRRKFEDTWLICPPDKTADEISLEHFDINSFRNDLKRGGDKDKYGLTDLIAQLDKAGSSAMLIPCFYVEDITDKGKPIVSFGHTKLFRLMYLHTISKCLPGAHFENPEDVDIAEAIFGRNEENSLGDKIKPLAGRVFFEDARAVGESDPSGLPEKRLRLLGPNPTSIQHYLVQKSYNRDKLIHYDSPNARLRGNKLYWHKTARYQPEALNDNLDNRIKPVGEGMGFSGRIRFENISDVELGALLSALKLPQGCRHKIGMGKSKGLGSIRINPTLFLSDRKKRYTLLSGDLGNTPETGFEDFCNAFNQYVLEQTGETNAKNLWETYRLAQFKHLLTIHHGISIKEIEDQTIRGKDFKQKKILPLPEDII